MACVLILVTKPLFRQVQLHPCLEACFLATGSNMNETLGKITMRIALTRILLCVCLFILICVLFKNFILGSSVDQPKQVQLYSSAASQANLLNYLFDSHADDFKNLSTTNLEVTRALLGNNSSKTAYIQRAMFAFSSSGELLDPSGHPYAFDRNEGILVVRYPNMVKKNSKGDGNN